MLRETRRPSVPLVCRKRGDVPLLSEIFENIYFNERFFSSFESNRVGFRPVAGENCLAPLTIDHFDPFVSSVDRKITRATEVTLE